MLKHKIPTHLVTRGCILVKDASSSRTLGGVHYHTQTSDGDTAGMEVECRNIGTEVRKKGDTIDGCGVWKRRHTVLKRDVSLVDLILATDDGAICERVDVEPSVASLDAKVSPHARGELCTEADEIRGRGTDPYVDASVVGHVTLEAWVQQGREGFTLGTRESIDGSETDRGEGNQHYKSDNLHTYIQWTREKEKY